MKTRIDRAEEAIHRSRVLMLLEDYSPCVVSTIFVELDTEDSDIDIVCSYRSSQVFSSAFETAYVDYDSYSLVAGENHIVGRFLYDGFPFEIYASDVPVEQQHAYRHYQIMQRLVGIGGESFKHKIRGLKQGGLKTEPAICQALGLSGDPYAMVLKLECWSNRKLLEHM